MPLFTADDEDRINRLVSTGEWRNLGDQERRELLADFETLEFDAIGRDLRDYRATVWHGQPAIKDMPTSEVRRLLEEYQATMNPPSEDTPA